MKNSENPIDISFLESYVCMMKFQERLKKLMKDRDFTQNSLAVKTEGKISVATINAYLNGDSEPNIERLTALASALGTTESFLIGNIDDPSPDAFKRPLYTEEEIAELGYHARGSEENELLSEEEMRDTLDELYLLRKKRLAREAERKKKFGDNPGSAKIKSTP